MRIADGINLSYLKFPSFLFFILLDKGDKSFCCFQDPSYLMNLQCFFKEQEMCQTSRLIQVRSVQGSPEKLNHKVVCVHVYRDLLQRIGPHDYGSKHSLIQCPKQKTFQMFITLQPEGLQTQETGALLGVSLTRRDDSVFPHYQSEQKKVAISNLRHQT